MTAPRLSQKDHERLCIVLECIEDHADQLATACAVNLTRGGLKALLERTMGETGWPLCPERLRKALANTTVAPIDTPRAEAKPTRVRFSEAFAEERAALREVLPAAGRGPRMSEEAIAARREQNEAVRRRHEDYWLTRERMAHGRTRQTMAGPLSEMPA